jgi:hypothetical protein
LIPNPVLATCRVPNRKSLPPRILGQLGVSLPEYALMIAVNYGTVPASSLPARAAPESADSVSEQDLVTAIKDCIAKGWLQIIDEFALQKIVKELRERNCIGPIYGLPTPGHVDFTSSGAEIWHAIRRSFKMRECNVPFAFTDVVHIRTARYFATELAAFACIDAWKKTSTTSSVSGPWPIGPWRAQWWRRFAEGFRVDVEERMQWSGRGSPGGKSCFMPWRSTPTNATNLVRSLARFGMSAAEWVLLASADNGWSSSARSKVPWWAAKFARQNFGFEVSDVALHKGLESCLRHRWLRVVDDEAFEEIAGLLRADPVSIICDRLKLRSGEFDFSRSGAELYRATTGRNIGTVNQRQVLRGSVKN